MVLARLQAAWAAKRLETRANSAVEREKNALGRLGAQVFVALEANGAPESTRELVAALRASVERVTSHGGARERSLAADRRDFADATQLVRWAVIFRGLLERVVLRDRETRDEETRFELEEQLGRLALDGDSAELRAFVPAKGAIEVAAAREDLRLAREERARLLAAYDGHALPDWLAAALRELANFVGFMWDQLTRKFFVRAPALAGLLVGWWIARRYTGSTHGTVLANLGLSDKQAVDADTLKQMEFWLPLTAGALCAYVSWVIARRVQNKYAPQPANDSK